MRLSLAKGLLADLTPLRRSVEFRKLFVGQTLTMVGSQVTQVAVPWQVYSISGSPLAIGMVGLAALLPIVVLGCTRCRRARTHAETGDNVPDLVEGLIGPHPRRRSGTSAD